MELIDTLHVCKEPCKIDGSLHLVDLVQKFRLTLPPFYLKYIWAVLIKEKDIIILTAARPMLSLFSHHHRVRHFTL